MVCICANDKYKILSTHSLGFTQDNYQKDHKIDFHLVFVFAVRIFSYSLSWSDIAT